MATSETRPFYLFSIFLVTDDFGYCLLACVPNKRPFSWDFNQLIDFYVLHKCLFLPKPSLWIFHKVDVKFRARVFRFKSTYQPKIHSSQPNFAVWLSNSICRLSGFSVVFTILSFFSSLSIFCTLFLIGFNVCFFRSSMVRNLLVSLANEFSADKTLFMCLLNQLVTSTSQNVWKFFAEIESQRQFDRFMWNFSDSKKNFDLIWTNDSYIYKRTSLACMKASSKLEKRKLQQIIVICTESA